MRRAETCGFAAWAWADYPGSREMGDAPTTFGAYTRDRAPRPEVVAALEEAFAEAREAAEQFDY